MERLSLLTDHQHAVAARALGEESAKRQHVVIALSGAHAYGFPSPDSDLDLKAIHLAPTRALLGLQTPRTGFDQLEVIEGVEFDYTSNELGGVLEGILRGNGNYIERVLGALICQSSVEHESLATITRAALSRQVHRHYAGFARSQREAFEHAEAPTAKKLLYALRTALTGVHLLRTGELRVDLGTVCDEYGFGHARELIETKRRGERVVLPASDKERWREDLDRVFSLLDEARDNSPLPLEAPNRADADAWLVQVRTRSLQ